MEYPGRLNRRLRIGSQAAFADETSDYVPISSKASRFQVGDTEGDHIRFVAHKSLIYNFNSKLSGGETGIRTLGGLAPTTVFETAAFDHSATSPRQGSTSGD